MGTSPDGRVVIVTGGSRGVGRETVQRLASLGYAVVVNYVHDQRTAEATVEAVLKARGAAVAIRADVADALDVERLFDQSAETFGVVDAVAVLSHHRIACVPPSRSGRASSANGVPGLTLFTRFRSQPPFSRHGT